MPELWIGFLTGALGAMSGASISHPLDLLKVRLQVQGEAAAKNAFGSGKLDTRYNYFLQNQEKLGLSKMMRVIYQSEGVNGFFKGLTASLFRQFIYSGTRFGVYDIIKGSISKQLGSDTMPLYLKIPAAAFSGGIGAWVGNPGDLCMVRMQADGKLPPELRRNYGNVGNALYRIVTEEGVAALWTGVGATVNRAAVVTVGHLAAYDQIKELMLTYGMEDNIITHFSSSFAAAFVASAISQPIDVAKTRLMNMKGERIYNGTFDCMRKTALQEGPLALYKGFSATYARQCPYVVVTWVTREQITKLIS